MERFSSLPVLGKALGAGMSPTKNNLGWFIGCYVPCCVSILGILTYMRLPWMLSQLGLLGSLGMLAIGETMAITTVLSFSAIATNGRLSGGGSYYLVSRSLGPEFGGALGISFYLAEAVGAAFSLLGMATFVQTTWLPVCGAGDYVESGSYCLHNSDPKWAIIIIGSGMLFVMTVISLAGAGLFSKFNIVFLGLQALALVVGVISFLHPHRFLSTNTRTGEESLAETHFPHYYSENALPNYTDEAQVCHGGMCDFHRVFAIMFPMVTGVLEGGNLSGDLKDPSRSLPKGTLYAVFTALTTYVILLVVMAGALPNAVLQADLNVFQHSCLGSSMLVILGALASSFTAALGNMFGGARVLQALARDNLFPILRSCAYGSRNGDEPRVSVLATFVVIQAFILIGNLDVLAPFITAIFCFCYGLINLACFVLASLGTPNFRPSFRYYSPFTAFLGFAMNFGVMLWLNWISGLVSILLMLVIMVYLAYFGPTKDWGDITQAIMFHQVRKYLLRLQTQSHAKFWRPDILLVANDAEPMLLEFCNSAKKGGLLVLGSVMLGPFRSLYREAEAINEEWWKLIRAARLKAFPKITVASSLREGVQHLVRSGGLGGMTVNTLVVPFATAAASGPFQGSRLPFMGDVVRDSDVSNPEVRVDASEFCALLCDAQAVEKNLLVTANYGFEALYSRGSDQWWASRSQRQARVLIPNSKKANIDVWLFGPLGLQTHYLESSSSAANTSCATALDAVSCASDTSFGLNGSFSSLTSSGSGAELFVGVHAFMLQLGQIVQQKLSQGADRVTRRLRVIYVPDVDGDAMSAELVRQQARAEIAHVVEAGRLSVSPADIFVFTGEDLDEAVPAFHDLVTRQYQQELAASPGRAKAALAAGASASAVAAASTVKVIYPRLSQLPLLQRCHTINQIIASASHDTSQIFTQLPAAPDTTDAAEAEQYVAALRALTNNLPPIALSSAAQPVAFISTEL